MASKQQPDMSQLISHIVDSIDPDVVKPDGEKTAFTKVQSKADSFIRNFRMKPTELIAFLEEYVIKQKEPLRILATEICGHYNAIRMRLEKGEDPMNDEGRIKPNILLLGPTGTGKTYMINLISNILGVPFYKADATKYTEAGYVGGDVEDIIRDLANSTKDKEGNVDIGMTQFGIVYIDEADKIASSGTVTGPDVSRGGVQQALLKLMEDSEVTLKTRMDPLEQIKMIKMMQEGKEIPKDTIRTKNILFIFSGAFTGLDPIIRKRMDSKSGMGFGSQLKSADKRKDVLENVQTADLVQYGLQPEFIGRIPIRTTLEDLDQDDYLSILKLPHNPVIAQFKDVMESYGITVSFDDEVLQYVAAEAAKENTGARGLQSAFSRAVSMYKTFLPDINIRRFDFIRPLVDGSFDQKEFIDRLRIDVKKRVSQMQKELEERRMKEASVEGFAGYILKKYGITLSFNEEAVDDIDEKAREEDKTPCAVCIKIFENFEIAFAQLKEMGITSLLVTKQAIENPVTFLERAYKK